MTNSYLSCQHSSSKSRDPSSNDLPFNYRSLAHRMLRMESHSDTTCTKHRRNHAM